MTNINSSVFRLPVKIIQLCLNIILGGIYKMTETVMTILLAILIGTFGVLSYLLGKLDGIKHTQVRMRNILEDSAKIVLDDFRKVWKT